MKVDVERAQGPVEIQHQAAQGSLWSFGNTIVSTPFAFVAGVLVARALGATDLGRLTVWITFTGLVNQFVNAGFSDATVQWFRSTQRHHGPEAALDILRSCTGYHWLVQAPLSGLGATGILLLSNVSIATSVAVGVLSATTMVVGTANVILTAVNQSVRAAQIGLAMNLSTTAATLVGAVTTRSPELAFLARTGVGLLLVTSILAQLPPRLRSCVYRPRLPIGMPPGMWAYSAKTAGAGLVTVLVFTRTEVLLLSVYGYKAAAAVYGIAFGLAAQVTSPLDALMAPLVPAAASLRANVQNKFEAALLRSIGLSAFAAGVVFGLLVPALVHLAPALYGREFRGVALLLVPLALVSVVQSMLHPIQAFGAAVRVPGRLLAVATAAVLIDAAVALIFVHRFRAAGATAANTAGQAVFFAGVVLVVSRPVGLSARRVLHACLGLLPGVLTGSAVLLLFLVPGWPPGILGALAGVGASLVLGTVILRLGPPVPGLLADAEALGASLPSRLRPLSAAVSRTQRRQPPDPTGSQL